MLDALRDMGINNIEELTLMEDPQLEGVNRGFSFIEFSTHKEALKAFRRLQQTDATFGTDRSAKVAWAQPLNEPDEETMSQVCWSTYLYFSIPLERWRMSQTLPCGASLSVPCMSENSDALPCC